MFSPPYFNLSEKYYVKLLVCSLITSVVLAENKTLYVDEQQKSHDYTCWASVSSMVSDWFNGDTNNRESEDRGNVYDIKSGVNHETGINGSATLRYLSYGAVMNQINNNGPIAAVCKNIGPHALLIKGYNDNSGDDVLYNDPDDGDGHRCSYCFMVNTFGWSNSTYWK